MKTVEANPFAGTPDERPDHSKCDCFHQTRLTKEFSRPEGCTKRNSSACQATEQWFKELLSGGLA